MKKGFALLLAMVLSFFRKGVLDLPLMILANLLWPMYGLMLVQPFMEFSGSMIALSMYKKQQGIGSQYMQGLEVKES